MQASRRKLLGLFVKLLASAQQTACVGPVARGGGSRNAPRLRGGSLERTQSYVSGRLLNIGPDSIQTYRGT